MNETIAIIGAGNVGSALAVSLSRAGRRVLLGVRDPGRDGVRALADRTGARLLAPAEAARDAPVVILALPWRAAEQAVRGLGDLAGKVVVDCMNPLAMVEGSLGLDRGYTTSGAEAVQGWIPGASVVKTLNQVGAEVMEDAAAFDPRPVMFLAGDDDGAKRRVSALLAAVGFEPLDAGPLAKARILEPLGMVWINQAMLRGLGRDWAFAVARRKGI